MKKHILISTIFLFFVKAIFADGLLMPKNKNYPKDFLRNVSSEITVNIKGLIAETVVLQEFENEWNDSVDAVYSFPLPENARATDIFYWYNDTMYRAKLKVKQQSVNPGTGEGGIAALVNNYIGKNGITIELKGIPGKGFQLVELHYVSQLEYYFGEGTYAYPLNTKDFIQHPLDFLMVNINVESNPEITGFEIPSHEGFTSLYSDKNHLKIAMQKSKEYVAKDLVFRYTVLDEELTADFYSCYLDSSGGYFNLLVRPPAIDMPGIMQNRVVFLIGNSSRMTGYKIQQTLLAIQESLDQLKPDDVFNILVFNNQVDKWQETLVEADLQNINKAKAFLETIETTHGSNMDLGLKSALEQIPDTQYNNSILVFSDGYSVVDPVAITELNHNRTGIFIVGIGDNIDRARLEMTAAYNFGFVKYMEDTGIKLGIEQIFGKINKPLLKDISLDFQKPDVFGVLPNTIPTAFLGSSILVCGRYKTPDVAQMLVDGEEYSGHKQYEYPLQYADNSNQNIFAAYLWAKQAIDALEHEIHIYGEDEGLKDSLIDLSLRFNIRCRYTAFVADYEYNADDIPGSGRTDFDDEMTSDVAMGASFVNNEISTFTAYPNPFFNRLVLKMNINNKERKYPKIIKIFNVLGVLVAVFDCSGYGSGMHEILIDVSSKKMQSGLYILQLEVGGKAIQTIKIHKR